MSLGRLKRALFSDNFAFAVDATIQKLILQNICRRKMSLGRLKRALFSDNFASADARTEGSFFCGKMSASSRLSFSSCKNILVAAELV